MKKHLGLVLLASVAFLPFHVNAGFQFTAPVAQQANQLMPMPSIIPEMPAVPAVKVQKQPFEPEVQSTAPVVGSSMPTPLNIPKSTSIVSPDDLAVGFGKDLPIMTAMKQVIPEGYTYVMDDGVSMAQNVSWSGGKPWPSVLNDMVEPLGFKAQLNGKIIRIVRPSIQTPIFEDVAKPNIMFDKLQTDEPYAATSQNNINSDSTFMDSPWTLSRANNTPQNLVKPLLRGEPIALKSTEIDAIKASEKTIIPDVTEGQWMAQSGSSLKTVLQSWSNIQGADLFWSADYDFMLAGDANISGNYEEAVEELLRGFSDAKPKPVARLHPNLPHGPAVLVVEAAQIN